MFQFKSCDKAGTVREAIALLQKIPDARIISGGTDVLIKLHEGKKGYEHLVDIHDIEELKQISINKNGNIVIGSGASFVRISESPIIKKHINVLSVAVSTIGGPQVRNMATIGGNICNGVTSADSASTLFALNAVLNIEGADGKRDIPIGDFYLGPGKVDLKSHEILISISITPDNYKGYNGHFYKYAMRNAMDIATIGCSSVCKVENGCLIDLRLAFGVAGPVPLRCTSTEKMAAGEKIDSELLNKIADNVRNDVNPRTSWRASKEFRL
ncbi:MAG: xanthine dehydrogenase FAD-binding subunit XdhB, partial [Candidatus Heimdallarchaeota archaeon]|nr:xanthine dehydrogenase FAD-binding subunit XdhB [Candidatus Heimdallarchaeota archaeon]